MTQPKMYKRHRFPPEIIQYAVWLYHRFNLSHRDVDEDLGGGVVDVDGFEDGGTVVSDRDLLAGTFVAH